MLQIANAAAQKFDADQKKALRMLPWPLKVNAGRD